MKKLANVIQRRWDRGRPWIMPSIRIILPIVQTTMLCFLAREKFFLRGHPEFETAAPIKRVCLVAMESILKRQASPALFDGSLVEQMERERYKIFDFAGEEKVFDVTKRPLKSTCTAILTDRLGIRYFTFRFRDSDDGRHIYGRYIDQIDESAFYNFTEAP